MKCDWISQPMCELDLSRCLISKRAIHLSQGRGLKFNHKLSRCASRVLTCQTNLTTLIHMIKAIGYNPIYVASFY